MVTALRLESSLASSSLASGAMDTARGAVTPISAGAADPLELAVPFRPTTLANFVVAATAAATA